MKIFFLILGMFVFQKANAVDIGQLEKDLNGSGVQGWIHGAVKEQGLYVFTYRNPKNFFDYVEMSLVAEQPALLSQLATLSRNDKVLVKGKFLANPSPQKHILLGAIELLKKMQSPYPSRPYEYEARIPDDLANISSAVFLVHAVAGEGKILVLEYKDAVLPIFVKNGSLTKNLFRNDLIRMSFKIQKTPGTPSHLNLDESAPEPLKVIEPIHALHGKPALLEGQLILFPKSPEILFNVFALQQELPAGLKRQYTLVNMDDPELFAKIRAKLQTAWDKFPGSYVNGRNKLTSLKLRVKATGTYNVVDQNQANAQIILKSADAIEISEH